MSLCLLLTISGNGYAQTVSSKCDELSLTYGRVSIPAFAMTLGSVLGVVFTGGAAKPEHIYSSGAIGLEYFHYFNGKFAVGGSAVYENFHQEWLTRTGTDQSGEPVYEPGSVSNEAFVSVMPAIKFRWFNRTHFGMYSKACAGVLLQPSSDSVSFGFQASPLGMEAGSSTVRGFAEFGLGTQGMVLAGVRVSL